MKQYENYDTTLIKALLIGMHKTVQETKESHWAEYNGVTIVMSPIISPYEIHTLKKLVLTEEDKE